MIITDEIKRRRLYKHLWYRKKKANDNGDIYTVRLCEDAMDKLRKVKREPKARKQQLAKRAERKKILHKKKQEAGYYAAIARRYRKRHPEECKERDRRYRQHLSPEKRAKRLAKHRQWNEDHHELIKKRALNYARHNRKRARINSKKWYYSHKQSKVKESD